MQRTQHSTGKGAQHRDQKGGGARSSSFASTKGNLKAVLLASEQYTSSSHLYSTTADLSFRMTGSVGRPPAWDPTQQCAKDDRHTSCLVMGRWRQ